ncbi:hypothetical protein [Nocardia tengchongensis]|uniref:hypothetical protein n=1 Tax=Nocardia tengchongensis TaxID=2055889 RepID=UPI0036648E29
MRDQLLGFPISHSNQIAGFLLVNVISGQTTEPRPDRDFGIVSQDLRHLIDHAVSLSPELTARLSRLTNGFSDTTTREPEALEAGIVSVRPRIVFRTLRLLADVERCGQTDHFEDPVHLHGIRGSQVRGIRQMF